MPARCWGWLNNHAYFGSENGGIYLGGEEYLNDNGAPINADVRFAWSSYKSVAKKNFKMMRLYTITDGLPRPFMDLEVDYNNVPPTNQPEITAGPSGGADWNTAAWDVDYWALRHAAQAELAGRHGPRSRRGPAHPRQRLRLHVLDHRRGRPLRTGRADVKIHFGDLPDDAQAPADASVCASISRRGDMKAPRWFSAWARDEQRRYRGHLRHRVQILVGRLRQRRWCWINAA